MVGNKAISFAMIYCCTMRPTRYKQRRQPCRTINCHKPSCHHKTHKTLWKPPCWWNTEGFMAAVLLQTWGAGASSKAGDAPSLASTTTHSSSRLLPCWGSGISFSWVLPHDFPKHPNPLDSVAMQFWSLLLVQPPSEGESLWKAPIWRCLSLP